MINQILCQGFGLPSGIVDKGHDASLREVLVEEVLQPNLSRFLVFPCRFHRRPQSVDCNNATISSSAAKQIEDGREAVALLHYCIVRIVQDFNGVRVRHSVDRFGWPRLLAGRTSNALESPDEHWLERGHGRG